MDLNDIEAAAAAKLEADRNARIAAVRELAQAARGAADARGILAAAEAAHTAKYRHATRLGWTDADLKEFGIALPGRKPAGRPQKQRKASHPTSAPAPVPEQAEASPSY
jgi:hypothetical protein